MRKLEQRFEEGRSGLADRRAALEQAVGALRARDERVSAITPVGRAPQAPGPSDAITQPGPLAELAPEGLERGEIVAIDTPGPDYLTLAVLAAALREPHLWCGAVGLPDLGGAALAAMVGPGIERERLRRLLVVPEPGERWPEVAAILAEGLDLIVLRPGAPVTAALARGITARLREGRARGRHTPVLVVLGAFPGARLTLRTEAGRWFGLHGDGVLADTGHLTARRARISAQGRATAGRRRVVELYLPAEDAPWATVETQVTGLSEQRAAA